ncbi:MAG: hypothetical protein K2P86_10060 [Xanthobacteraceae bacterium]|nr:hypothetical protein [Xanthobacteraceae bacterium]
MKSIRLIVLAFALFFAAAPMELSRVEAQQVCHHYRWSSQRACTSAKTLRFVARPPLYYPSRYFGRPHYYYEQRLYWSRQWHAYNRWYGWPYRYW